jgi:heme/copper-type cytochrome/quinol oxidase subunit 2
MDAEQKRERKQSTFDLIVLVGMVANIVLAVFMLLYYFDLL